MKHDKRIVATLLSLVALSIACTRAYADQILVFFDCSDSIRAEDRSRYYLDFKKLEFHPGDTVVILPLGRNTHEFQPVARIVIPEPDRRLSHEANRERETEVLQRARAAVRTLLRKTETATYILGAFIASRDYFVQENVDPAQRKIYIFSDMIEQAGKLNFQRNIPPEPDKRQLPADLQASVHILGVTVSADKRAALETYWRKAVEGMNSKLVTYRHSL
jgi:hypothetical protein